MQGGCTQALKAALELARTGLAVFPCAHNKHPRTPHGLLDASTDPGALRKLWAQHPGPLVGIRTGSGSVDVLDLDTRAPAREWWSLNRINIPPTQTHRTRSGGLHLLFQHAPSLRCSTSKIARGVDVRADGGYIISWPAAGLPVLHDSKPAPWPPWLLAELKPPMPPPPSRLVIPDDRRLEQLLRCVASAPEGQRNAITYWASCRFGEMVGTGLISETDAVAAIVAAAMVAGLPHNEAMATARSGLRTAGRS
jgi:hypothetical protein